MLARGVLCRLAAEAPKTSTHDLSQLVHVLQRSVLSRNGLSLPAVCAVSRAYRAALVESRRSYATTTRATKPTATVKKAVKKTAAKKTTPASKKASAKKSTKKATAKKAKPKKKPAAKPKRAKKVLTPEEKEKLRIKELRKKALKEPHSNRPLTTINVFCIEALTGQKTNGPAALGDAVAKFKSLTPAELEVSRLLFTRPK